MKKCIIIYNPIASNINKINMSDIKQMLKTHDYETDIIRSEFPNHIPHYIKKTNADNDLVITVGGDGTFGEAMQGYHQIEQNALYTHLPLGTNNDTSYNLGLNKHNPINSLALILEGQPQTIDILTVNDLAFANVSAFGYLSNVSYETSIAAKQKLHHLAYVLTAMKELSPVPEPTTITYTKDNKKYETSCLFGAISNGKKVAGVKVHPNADLDDGLFEVLLLKKMDQKLGLMLIADYLKGELNLTKYNDYIEVFKTNHTIIDFIKASKSPVVNNDGDRAHHLANGETNSTLEYKTAGKVKMLLPKK